MYEVNAIVAISGDYSLSVVHNYDKGSFLCFPITNSTDSLDFNLHKRDILLYCSGSLPKENCFLFRLMCGIGANYNSRHSHRSAQLEKSMEHNSFILHHKQWCQLSQLTDEELGKIMRAIYLYRTE